MINNKIISENESMYQRLIYMQLNFKLRFNVSLDKYKVDINWFIAKDG